MFEYNGDFEGCRWNDLTEKTRKQLGEMLGGMTVLGAELIGSSSADVDGILIYMRDAEGETYALDIGKPDVLCTKKPIYIEMAKLKLDYDNGQQ